MNHWPAWLAFREALDQLPADTVEATLDEALLQMERDLPWLFGSAGEVTQDGRGPFLRLMTERLRREVTSPSPSG